MASTKVWFAKDGEMEVGAPVGTVNGTDALETQHTAVGNWKSRVKNIRIELGTRDIEPINVMGQQQLKQENRPEIVSLTFNTVMYPQGSASNDTLFSWLFGLGAAVGATGYNRYRAGEKATNDRTDMGFLVKLSRPGGAVTDTITFLLNNATVTSGPVSLDAEGHAEQEWTVKCLATDLYIDAGLVADPDA